VAMVPPGSGATYSYEPYSSLKSVPFYKLYPDGHGKERVRALHGGSVVMTPHTVSTSEYENFLIHVPMCNGGMHRYCSRPQKRKVGGVCTISCYNKEVQQDFNTWDEVYDYDRWASSYPTLVHSNRINMANINDLLAEVRHEAASKSYRDYDALTDFCQLKDTATMFPKAASSVHKAFRKFANSFPFSDLQKASTIAPSSLARHASRAFRSIGNAWLMYRYGLMPLIYSLKDISKVYSRSTCITDRAFRTISPESSDPSLPASGGYTLRTESGTISVRAVVTCKYSSRAMSLAQKIGINPFSTAWELIPFSFVADWFINIGDYITVATTPDFSSSSGACTVVKKEITVEYTACLIRSSNYLSTEQDVAKHQPLCWGSYPSVPTYPVGAFQGVLRKYKLSSYSRQLFARSASLAPPVGSSMNWRRWSDSIALSNQLIRSIRKMF